MNQVIDFIVAIVGGFFSAFLNRTESATFVVIGEARVADGENVLDMSAVSIHLDRNLSKFIDMDFLKSAVVAVSEFKMEAGVVAERNKLTFFVVFLKRERSFAKVMMVFYFEGFLWVLAGAEQSRFYFVVDYRGFQFAVPEHYLIAAPELQTFLEVGAPPVSEEPRVERAAVVSPPQLEEVILFCDFEIHPGLVVASVFQVDFGVREIREECQCEKYFRVHLA